MQMTVNLVLEMGDTVKEQNLIDSVFGALQILDSRGLLPQTLLPVYASVTDCYKMDSMSWPR